MVLCSLQPKDFIAHSRASLPLVGASHLLNGSRVPPSCHRCHQTAAAYHLWVALLKHRAGQILQSAQCLTSMQQQSVPFVPHLSISPHPVLPKTPLPPLTLALRVPLSVLQSPTGPSDIPNPQIHHFPLLISYQGQADPPQS